jgi:hypothetical protein
MGALGVKTELINATKVHLDLGSDRFVMLQEMTLNIDHPESRESADIGSLWFYGWQDNFFEATLLLSSPELNTFIGYTELTANNDLPENDFKLIYTDKAGAIKTLTITCTVPSMQVIKSIVGGVKTKIKFRIVEEITVSDDLVTS